MTDKTRNMTLGDYKDLDVLCQLLSILGLSQEQIETAKQLKMSEIPSFTLEDFEDEKRLTGLHLCLVILGLSPDEIKLGIDLQKAELAYNNVVYHKDIEQQSTLLYEMLMTMGYSQEEIEVRREYGRLSDIFSGSRICFLTKPNCYAFQSGSSCEGLEGNLKITQIPTDQDLLCIYDKHEVRDGNNLCIHVPIASHLIVLTEKTINHPGVFMEDVKEFPGYVRLFRIVNYIKHYYSSCTRHFSDKEGNFYDVKEFNGPALTLCSSGNVPYQSVDFVYCRVFNGWPSIANEWLFRTRPNKWPSEEVINFVAKQGCLISPVGHFDSKDSKRQWRISFQGEGYLFSKLNHIQLLCYVILKWILKTEIKNVANEAISSYHIKNLIWWCAESCSLEWLSTNLLECIRQCIQIFKACVRDKKLSHYIIPKRNLFNSKLTAKARKDVEQILNHYECNISNIFKLDILKNAIFIGIISGSRERATYVSIIGSCFATAYMIFKVTDVRTFNLLDDCSSFHDVSLRLHECINILKYLYTNKTTQLMPSIFYIESVVGMLYFARFKETNKELFLKKAKYYFNLHRQNGAHFACIQLRFAIFLIMNYKYEDAKAVCLNFVHDEGITHNTHDQPIEEEVSRIIALANKMPTKELCYIKKQVLNAFFCKHNFNSGHCSTYPGSCDILSSFKQLAQNLSNFSYYGVSIYKAEQWVVSDVLLFEILLVAKGVDRIVVSVELCSLLLLFLSYNKTKMEMETNKVLAMMDLYLDKRQLTKMKENPQSFESFYRQIRNSKDLYTQNDENEGICEEVKLSIIPRHDPTVGLYAMLNEHIYRSYYIVAYCNLKAQNYTKASRYILKSMIYFTSKQNAAFGYLKIISSILRQLDGK